MKQASNPWPFGVPTTYRITPTCFQHDYTRFLPNEAQVVKVDVFAFPLLRAGLETKKCWQQTKRKNWKKAQFPNNFALQKRPRKRIESKDLLCQECGKYLLDCPRKNLCWPKFGDKRSSSREMFVPFFGSKNSG